MNKDFMSENFLLETSASEELYHGYASGMPIFDYHSHLPADEIAADINFANLGQVWLKGDHYKWRAMRSNGVEEKYCTGDASDREKFQKWAETIPYCLRNPLYHWSHMELRRCFGINAILNPSTAREIYELCSAKLAQPDYSVRGLITMMNVRVICTTNDPLDTLADHVKIRNDGFDVKVLPTLRPDKVTKTENVAIYNKYLDDLSAVSDIDIRDYDSLIEAVKSRHDFFHDIGCRLSDHGVESAFVTDFTDAEVKMIFAKVRGGVSLSHDEVLKLRCAVMLEFGRMDHERGWVQQLHIGALRNNNTRMFNKLGPDAGFDSIADDMIARSLSGYLDRLDSTDQLPKTILYNLNPRDNALLATMAGNFQDGSMPGKMQFGSGWWFLDQKFGMEDQINTLSVLGLLSRFVGMLTDSRSFLSFPRHEYFRRILCNLLGKDIENGEIPYDMKLVGSMVQDICFNNAVSYFGIKDIQI